MQYHCSIGCSIVRVFGGAVIGVAVQTAGASVAFDFGGPITDPILSASFHADFASLTAHRFVAGHEVNMVRLVDVNGNLPDLDLSEQLFGTSAWPAPAILDQGPVETGLFWATIDPAYFSVLAKGRIGLWALFTDTDDALFAIDFLSITVETAAGTFEAFHGTPVGNENNGFGLGLADGGVLPAPMPGVLIPTGTGFDEEISSKAIHAVPAPQSLLVMACGAACASCRRRRVPEHRVQKGVVQ